MSENGEVEVESPSGFQILPKEIIAESGVCKAVQQMELRGCRDPRYLPNVSEFDASISIQITGI